MLTLSSNRGTAWTHKKSRQKTYKIYQFYFTTTFFLVILRVIWDCERLAAYQNDMTVPKRKTLCAHPRYSITYSSKGQRWSGQYKALPLPLAEPKENPCSRPKIKDHPGTLRFQPSAWSRGIVITLLIEGSMVRILLCMNENISCHVLVLM